MDLTLRTLETSTVNPEAKADFEQLFDSIRAIPPIASFEIPEPANSSEFTKHFFGIK